MTDNNRDRRYIHELALEEINKADYYTVHAHSPDGGIASNDLIRAATKRWKAGSPFLTDQASATLEEVEFLIEECKACPYAKLCDTWLSRRRKTIAANCSLARLRWAYEKGKRHGG